MIPSPLKPAKPSVPRARARTMWSANPDVRSVQIGVVATILVHVLLLVWAPRIQVLLESRLDSSSTNLNSGPIEVEWRPEPFKFLEEKPEPKAEEEEKSEVTPPIFPFVETNPNAPDNVPDKTQNTAGMNQQVAQEKPTTESKSDIPEVTGSEKDAMSIVDGESYENRTKSTPSDYQPEIIEIPAARRAQTPLSGTEKFSGDEASTPGSNIADPAPDGYSVPKPVDGLADATNTEGLSQGLYFKVDPKRPMPRKALPQATTSHTKPGMLIQNRYGTANIGITASNAKWSQFGDYSEKLGEVVGVQAERIFNQSIKFPPSGTKVSVYFKLNSLGEVAEIVKVIGDASQSTRYGCVSAIVDRAPYGKWPQEMTDVLGDDIVVEFTFYFQ